jgi:hypothetical protein
MLHELNNQLEVLASVMKIRERATEAEAIPNVPHLAMVTIRNGRSRPARLEIPHDIHWDIEDWCDEWHRLSPAQRACGMVRQQSDRDDREFIAVDLYSPDFIRRRPHLGQAEHVSRHRKRSV